MKENNGKISDKTLLLVHKEVDFDIKSKKIHIVFACMMSKLKQKLIL